MPEGLSALLFSGLLFGGLADFQWIESPLQGCMARDQTSQRWRDEGRRVFDHQAGDWCVVASLHQGHWEAEQWRRSPAEQGHGWRVRLPLQGVQASSSKSAGQDQVFHVGDQRWLRIRPAHGASLHEAHARERQRLTESDASSEALGHAPPKNATHKNDESSDARGGSVHQDSSDPSRQRFWISHFEGKEGIQGLITLRIEGEGWFHVSLHHSPNGIAR